jgi:hypothetical protein
MLAGDYSALVMQRVTMSNCQSLYGGGAMQLGGTLSYGLDGAPGPFQSISIINCTTASFGGAINLLMLSNVTFKDSIIDNSYCGNFGGNIVTVFSILTLENTIISRGSYVPDPSSLRLLHFVHPPGLSWGGPFTPRGPALGLLSAHPSQSFFLGSLPVASSLH